MKRLALPRMMTLALVMAMISAVSMAATIPNSVPPYVSTAQNLGGENPSRVIQITVNLALHNRADRDALLKQLYDRNSPLYQKWLTPEEYASRFAPSTREATMVQDYLKSQGLSVTAVNKFNYTVTATGTVADVQKAFGVQIDRFLRKGEMRYSNINNPTVPTQLTGVMASIGGLHEVRMKPHHVMAADLNAKTPLQGRPVKKPGQIYWEYQCYRGTEVHAFTTHGKVPAALYTGNRYGADIDNGQGHLPPCGFEPEAMQTAYGLKPVYQSGLDGSGQTVVIVDAFGSPTAADDIAEFSSTFSLPAANFAKFDPQGPPDYDSGWAGETTLDIEWAHAMAPGAKIVLLEAIDNFDNNLMGAIQYSLDNSLGNVISNSYGSDEADDDSQDMQAWDDLNANAAALGVSVNFSTGDDGDFARDVGVATVSVPSNSPHATAVGGVSVFLNADYSIQFQTGWGTTLTQIAEPPDSIPDNPPICFATGQPGQCFYYGAGGGESQFFPKPSYQSSLPGTGRQQPDVSLTADPYTGVTIIWSYDDPGNFSVGVIGGTSASCPMFSGVWALVNQKSQQKNGHSAGLAAPYMYTLPKGAVLDVIQTSPHTLTILVGQIHTGEIQPIDE
jgi:subtilase family serine protease